MKTMMKQHVESIESFKKGQRQDLVEKEEKELQILKEFVPAQMSGEEVAQEVDSAIETLGAHGPEGHGEGDESPDGKTCIPCGWKGVE